jgi:hypothetical protein
MSVKIMQTAKLVRGAVLSATLALGGCEVLGQFFDGEVPARADQAVADARLPGPPPPAPRVARPSSRRLTPERDGVGETAPESMGDQQLESAARDGAASPSPDAQPDPTATPRVAALPSPADLPPPVDPASEVRPQRVVGLTENALAQWLGPPANTREESPARVWRYQGIECAFDVFFYLDLVSREFRALRYEVKGSSNDDQRCLQPVFAGRGSPPRATARRVD